MCVSSAYFREAFYPFFTSAKDAEKGSSYVKSRKGMGICASVCNQTWMHSGTVDTATVWDHSTLITRRAVECGKAHYSFLKKTMTMEC